jgi:hypothetical protein
MSYENLCYDQLAFKASHNSYERDESVLQQLHWSVVDSFNGGCRGLEFDINRFSDESNGTTASYFQVNHDQHGEGPFLATYLQDLLSFHESDPDHDPIFVSLDIKSEDGSVTVFPDEIDNYLTAFFDKFLICTPAQVMPDESLDLVANLQETGWPLLSDLRGKFIFCLSGTEEWKSTYAVTDPRQRLCFADFGVDDDDTETPVTGGPRAVANLHLSSDDYSRWKQLVPSLRAQRLLVRAYVLNSDGIWDKAQGAGVNVLSTDKVSDYEWAMVGTEPFAPSAPQVS